MMKRYKCIVSYNGHNYVGWQSQRQHNSIQEIIEKAISKVCNDDIKITGASRTDAGVNALGQVFHFDCDHEDIECWQWQKAINNFLPDDIYIRSVEEVDDNFFARYCVKRKQYDYVINQGEYDVFLKDRTFHFPYPLDIEQMKTASKVFIGRHDFTSFCTSSLEKYPNQVRTIEDIKFNKDSDLLTISFIGEGFLRYMVRMISATLIEVGRGKTSVAEVQAMLEAKDKEVCKRNAKPQGLTLINIEYYRILFKNEEVIIREFIDADKSDCTDIDINESNHNLINKKIPHCLAIANRHINNKCRGYIALKEVDGKIEANINADKMPESIEEIEAFLGSYVNKLGYQDLSIKLNK